MDGVDSPALHCRDFPRRGSRVCVAWRVFDIEHRDRACTHARLSAEDSVLVALLLVSAAIGAELRAASDECI